MVSSILPRKITKKFDLTTLQSTCTITIYLLWYLWLTYLCSVFGRIWRHQRDILKITDLYYPHFYQHSQWWFRGQLMVAKQVKDLKKWQLTRLCTRFFDQFGHQNMSAYTRSKQFFNFSINKIHQANNWSTKKIASCTNLALVIAKFKPCREFAKIEIT